jgi:putative peptidoglycan lipid II flippase
MFGAGSDVALAWRVGARASTDAYFAGITIPLTVAGILGSAATFTFVPMLVAARQRSALQCAGVLWDVFAGLAMTGAVLAAAISVSADAITSTVFARLPPATHALATTVLVRFAAVIPFAALTEILTAAHYLRSRVYLPSAARLVPAGATFSYLLLAPSPSVVHLAEVSALGIAGQVAVLTLGLWRSPEFGLAGRVRAPRDVLRRAALATLPMVAGMLVYRSIPVVERSFLSAFPEGSIAAVAFASRIFQAAQGVLGAGLVASMLRPVNELVAAAEWERLAALVQRGCRVLLFLLVPVALVYAGMGPGPLRLTLARRFTPQALANAHIALSWYLVALVPAVLGTVVSQVLYAMSETTRVTVIGFYTTAHYVAAIPMTKPFIGIAAVPMAFAGEVLCGLVVTLWALNRRLRLRGAHGISLWPAVVRYGTLALLLALALAAARHALVASDLAAGGLSLLALAAYGATASRLPGLSSEPRWLLSRLVRRS